MIALELSINRWQSRTATDSDGRIIIRTITLLFDSHVNYPDREADNFANARRSDNNLPTLMKTSYVERHKFVRNV